MELTQEDKQLLLADLCARLPHGVKISTHDGSQTMVGIICTNGGGKVYTSNMLYNISQVKLYLRPMSSMTEEEKKDLLVTIVGNEGSKYFQVLQDGSINNTDDTIKDLNKFNMHWVNFDKDTVTLYLDWLNAHHFDYRGLIEKGLALEAPEGMYGKE